jgi:rubrerythrin
MALTEARALTDVLAARLRGEPDKDGWALIARQADELARVARRQVKAIEAIDVVRARREAYEAERATSEARRAERREAASTHAFEPKLDEYGTPVWTSCAHCAGYLHDHDVPKHKLDLLVTEQPSTTGRTYTQRHCRICGQRANAFRRDGKLLWRH